MSEKKKSKITLRHEAGKLEGRELEQAIAEEVARMDEWYRARGSEVGLPRALQVILEDYLRAKLREEF